jgi:hypothetical protein
MNQPCLSTSIFKFILGKLDDVGMDFATRGRARPDRNGIVDGPPQRPSAVRHGPPRGMITATRVRRRPAIDTLPRPAIRPPSPRPPRLSGPTNHALKKSSPLVIFLIDIVQSRL